MHTFMAGARQADVCHDVVGIHLATLGFRHISNRSCRSRGFRALIRYSPAIKIGRSRKASSTSLMGTGGAVSGSGRNLRINLQADTSFVSSIVLAGPRVKISPKSNT